MILKNSYKERRKIKSLVLYIVLFLIIIERLPSFDVISSRWSKPIPLSILNSYSDDYSPTYNRYDNLFYYSSSRNGNTYFFTSRFVGINFESPNLLKSSINQTAKHQNYISFFVERVSLFLFFQVHR